MSKEFVSNYEKVYEHYKQIFLQMDHQKAADKLALRIDKDFLYIPYFNQPIILERKTADFRIENDVKEVQLNDKLLIMHHLHFYKDYASLSGSMVAFREIKGLSFFEAAYNKHTLEPLAKAFMGKPHEFISRVRAIGASIESFGDASFTINAFPKIPLTYIFWDGDDEMSAAATVLFDKNITWFIHMESVPVLASAGAHLLMGSQ